MKVALIRSCDANKLVEDTNEFIKDKKVVDIKFNDMTIQTGGGFKGYEIEPVTSVLVIYED